MSLHDDAGSAPRRKFGLALAGGVLEGGFYEVGVLCALQDAIEGLDFTRLDVYVGVSSGAVITSLLANGLSPRTLSRAFSGRGRTNDFRRLGAKLRVVAVKLDSSELVTFGGAGHDHVPISRAVQASLALPGFYCPVAIDGEDYIDGVARRTLNASVALDEGTDLLFCVNPIVPVDVHGGANGNGAGGNGKRARGLADYGL